MRIIKNSRMVFEIVCGVVFLLALLGCEHLDSRPVDKLNRVKYVMRVVNSSERQVVKSVYGEVKVTPWVLTVETSSDIGNMRSVSGEVKCKVILEHAEHDKPLLADFTLHRKKAEHDGNGLGMTQFGMEHVSVPLDDGWKLEFYLSEEDYPIPQPIAATFSFGAYMRENFGNSVFSNDGFLVVVGNYVKDKTIYIDMTRYTVRGASLVKYNRIFSQYAHGEISRQVIP